MKVKELMIGDIVKQKHSGLILKVSETVPPYIRAEGEYVQFHEDTVEPIPLTPDILEKNEIDTVFKTRYKGFYLEYHAEAGMIMLYVYNNGSFQPTGIGFKYVHELQRALRLCGIDKTIEL